MWKRPGGDGVVRASDVCRVPSSARAAADAGGEGGGGVGDVPAQAGEADVADFLDREGEGEGADRVPGVVADCLGDRCETGADGVVLHGIPPGAGVDEETLEVLERRGSAGVSLHESLFRGEQGADVAGWEGGEERHTAGGEGGGQAHAHVGDQGRAAGRAFLDEIEDVGAVEDGEMPVDARAVDEAGEDRARPALQRRLPGERRPDLVCRSPQPISPCLGQVRDEPAVGEDGEQVIDGRAGQAEVAGDGGGGHRLAVRGEQREDVERVARRGGIRHAGSLPGRGREGRLVGAASLGNRVHVPMGGMPTLTTDGPVWTLDLGSDENRFSPGWLDVVEGLLTQVTDSAEPVGLVVGGSGKFFTNGLDLDWVMANPGDFFTYAARVQAMLSTVLTLPVPTIAAINGHAFGAGAMLALACDFRVMRADRGFWCLPEADIRIPFTRGMSALIQSKLTPQAATASMTTGRRFGGGEAAAYGIVDAVADEAGLAAAAAGVVAPLAGKDRTTLGTIKRRMYAATVDALAEVPS